MDRYAPVDFKTFLQHQWFDVIPAILCCKGLFSDCSKYYDRRPSHNGENCNPTPPGQLHLVNAMYILSTVLFGLVVLTGYMQSVIGYH